MTIRFAGLIAGSAAVGLMLLGSAVTASAQQRPEYDFTMGVITSPGDVYTAMTQGLPERISKATDGRVRVTVSDSLVAANQIASAVRDGRLPMSAALHTYISSEDPRMGIFNLPGLINGIQEYDTVRKAFWRDDVKAIWADKWNAVMLADGAWCPTALFSKTPIHKVEDFRGKRIRVHNPQTAELMSALGALPVPLPTSELTPALERGVIDGVFTSICVGSAFELPRVAPHVQDWAMSPVTGWVILINADTWAKMPADLKEKIAKAMLELQEEAFSTYQTYVERAVKKVESLGSKLWVAPDGLKAEASAPRYADPAYASWYARSSELGFDGKAYVKKVRQALGKE